MKARLLLIDESHLWSEDFLEKFEGIFGLYFFNADEVTYCCEMTPSYECHFVYSVPVHLPEDDKEREKLLDIMKDADASDYDNVKYFHCRDIDKLPEIKAGEYRAGVYSFEVDFDEEEDKIEDILEDLHANHRF